MQFRIDLNRVSQRRIRAEVAVDVAAVLAVDDGPAPARDHLEFLLPVWTPGSYLVREYARHLTRVVAVDGVSGVALEVSKPAKNRYRVELPEGCERVVVRYEVYANSLTVREAAVSDEFAFWDGACVYLWPVGCEDRPADVRVDLPEGWELFCGARLEGTGFSVSGLAEAVDMPCLAAPSTERFSFEAAGCDVRFVAAGLGGVRLPETLQGDVRRVVECAAKVFEGDVPIDAYTFLSLFADRGRGGLEHRNSSVLLAPRTTFDPRRSYEEFMGLVAHEFFHVWNGKGMRPREFVRFDYERENHTRLLWVIEGFTAYYDDHLCLRAGILAPKDYLRVLATHAEAIVKSPGRLEQSLAAASFDAWIRFYRPDENTRNSTQNYYSNGALLAFCIDSRIREASRGERSLDDVMRGLWARSRDDGYDLETVIECIDEAAGVELGAEVLALVDGPFEPDLSSAFAAFGLDADWKVEKTPTIGVQFAAGETRIASVIADSPAWHAGLGPGDEILAVDDLRVKSDTWLDVYPTVATADRPLRVTIARRGRLESLEVTPTCRATGSLSITAAPGASKSALQLRADWLGEL